MKQLYCLAPLFPSLTWSFADDTCLLQTKPSHVRVLSQEISADAEPSSDHIRAPLELRTYKPSQKLSSSSNDLGTTAAQASAGNSNCPCVSVDFPSNATDVSGNVLVEFALPGGTGTTQVTSAYQRSVGSYCHAWDDGAHPQCQGTVKPVWCSQNWCYVDLCNCNLDVLPTHNQYVAGTSYDGRTSFYSYRTCGEVDSYSATENPLACPTQRSEYECSTQSQCVWTDLGCAHSDIVSQCRYS